MCKFKFSTTDLLCASWFSISDLCASSSSRLQTSCVQVQVLDYRLVVCKLVLDFRIVCKFKFWIADKLCASSKFSIADLLCASSSSRLQTCCVRVQVLDCRLVVCKFKFSIADKLRSPDDRYNPVVNENGGFSVTAVALPPISRQPCIDTWTLWIMIIIDASCYKGNQRWKALDFIFYFWSRVYVNKAFFFFFFFYY
jgi:hypothetical protein